MISSVVVLHHPDPVLLKQQHDALAGEVDAILYVDNGGGRAALADTGLPEVLPTTMLGSGENVGLAAALNLALRHAKNTAAEYVLLLDHDSVPEPGMVATMLDQLRVSSPPHPAAAIGPAIVDMLHDRTEYFTRLRLPLNKRIDPRADPTAFEVDFLITSGTLIRLDTLDDIGLMDERLSIDSVDFDWSFRATAAGYSLLATFGARLLHRRGELQPVLAGQSLRIHSPARLYFMHRNRILLYRRDYVPLAWKLHDFARMVAKATLLVTVAPNRWANVKAMSRGVRDGLLGRSGGPLTRSVV